MIELPQQRRQLFLLGLAQPGEDLSDAFFE
jgi:hypothetical protein